MANTLFEKLWSDHVVDAVNETTDIIYIDQHLIHEVTSPVAFSGLENRGKKSFPSRTDCCYTRS
jgi:3-isopropylmalate/(R)-2-methylmalate dehydratase large subunit